MWINQRLIKKLSIFKLDPDEERKRLLIALPSILGIPIIIGFAFHNFFVVGLLGLGIINIVAAAVFTLCIISLRYLKEGLIVYRIIVAVLTFFFL